MLSMPNVWFVVVVACLVWYATVTVYVAVRGAQDIKHMLARLARTDAAEDESPD